MNKLLAVLLLVFTFSSFVAAPEAEAAPARHRNFHKHPRQHHHHHLRHHHKVIVIR